jgi:hypothetical protein
MVGEVTIYNGDDMRKSNSARPPVSRDTPELERRTKTMPAVQITDPTAVSVEIDVINRGHHFPPLQPAEDDLSLRWARAYLIINRDGSEFCQ